MFPEEFITAEMEILRDVRFVLNLLVDLVASDMDIVQLVPDGCNRVHPEILHFVPEDYFPPRSCTALGNDDVSLNDASGKRLFLKKNCCFRVYTHPSEHWCLLQYVSNSKVHFIVFFCRFHVVFSVIKIDGRDSIIHCERSSSPEI